MYLLACFQLGRLLYPENRTLIFFHKLCVTSALFLGNIICARKYRFTLCFRVLSNQYVESSAYANVFKFNRERQRFERAKVNSRCLHWFPAALLESLRGLQHGIFILNTVNFSYTLCRITRARNIVHPRSFGALFIYYSSTIFQFLGSIY